jgi:hypothetical protein
MLVLKRVLNYKPKELRLSTMYGLSRDPALYKSCRRIGSTRRVGYIVESIFFNYGVGPTVLEIVFVNAFVVLLNKDFTTTTAMYYIGSRGRKQLLMTSLSVCGARCCWWSSDVFVDSLETAGDREHVQPITLRKSRGEKESGHFISLPQSVLQVSCTDL